MQTEETDLNDPRPTGLTIGLGMGANPDLVRMEAKLFEDNGIGKVRLFESPGEMVEALISKEIAAAVRGTLPAGPSMQALKTKLWLDKVMRAAMMEDSLGRLFFLYPVGIDEGRGRKEKVEAVRLMAPLIQRLGTPPKIAVLAGGRLEDRGRSKEIARSLDAAADVVSTLNEKGLDAENHGICIENALLGCNIVIAPDGISGNLVWRSLHYLGGCEVHGAPVLNTEHVFIDTSRARASYMSALMLAATLAQGD